MVEARLKQNPNDTEALYFFGAIEGLKASFEETVERRHFAALKDGNDAVDKHRQVIKLDPNYRDAEMTIGLYDYTVGALPLPTKIAVGFLGHRGSKKRGIATVRDATTMNFVESAQHAPGGELFPNVARGGAFAPDPGPTVYFGALSDAALRTLADVTTPTPARRAASASPSTATAIGPSSSTARGGWWTAMPCS